MNTKLKCLLLDDELPGLTYLKMLCEQLPELEVVKAFDNPVIFLNTYAQLDFDFCILDIEMPDMNGLQLAEKLNKPVIFTTAYKEYASEAFDINAVDYIRKPVKKERLQQAVYKVKARLEAGYPRNQFIQLNTDKGKSFIYFSNLLYLRTSDTDSRDKVALLNDGTEITLKNISYEKLQSLLPPDLFVRVNKKEMLSLKAISVFSSDEITTNIRDATGHFIKVSISETYRKGFVQKISL